MPTESSDAMKAGIECKFKDQRPETEKGDQEMARKKKKSSGTTSRSAKTGRFVTKKYADSHKSTTVTSKKKKK
jgi:hypothetical protein